MSSKTALIVDDSASARLVLGRMLVEHGLEVDTAESAEEALEYLGHHRPDVVFMDHMMPGMDGLQALKAIKGNPDTATIPVMMYTSQEGEVYVGQARALGAIGVLPKQVKPVEVSEILHSLRLMPGQDEGESETAGAGGSGADTAALPALLEDLFDQQRALLREEIRASYSELARQTPETTPAAAPAPSGLSPAVAVAMAGLAAVALAFVWLYVDAIDGWRDASARNEQLIAALEREDLALVNDLRRPGSDVLPTQPLEPTWVEALQWSLNQGGTYAWNELAFGESSADRVTGLVERLAALGFAGTVVLESHLGRFCSTGGGEEAGAPLDDDVPVADCARIGFGEGEAVALGSRESIGFANALAALERAYGDQIRVRTVSRGEAEPRLPYPTWDGATAADWNRIARQNQRVEFRLESDAVGLTAQ